MKQGSKAAVKEAQSGVPVSEKNYSSKKKEGAAAGTSGTKKGSLTFAKSLPVETGSSTPVPSKNKYEGSSKDWSQDYAGAKRLGMSTSDYEDSARDRVADVAGERRMAADESKTNEYEVHGSQHKRGVPAFANPPKNSHGFGHPTSARDGHLRNSGNSSAHRIGKKR